MTLVERVAEWPKQWLREGREQGVAEGRQQGVDQQRALLSQSVSSEQPLARAVPDGGGNASDAGTGRGLPLTGAHECTFWSESRRHLARSWRRSS